MKISLYSVSSKLFYITESDFLSETIMMRVI